MNSAKGGSVWETRCPRRLLPGPKWHGIRCQSLSSPSWTCSGRERRSCWYGSRRWAGGTLPGDSSTAAPCWFLFRTRKTWGQWSDRRRPSASTGSFFLKRARILSIPKPCGLPGGAVFQVRFQEGPSLRELPETLPIVPLSSEGTDIAQFEFPEVFAFLPGMEGPGLPNRWREQAVSIPIHPRVESLNAATATGIALYVWSRSAGRLPARRLERP